jgi:hypothetical protein
MSPFLWAFEQTEPEKEVVGTQVYSKLVRNTGHNPGLASGI